MADSAKSVNGNGVKTSQKKRSYWFRKYVISLVIFVFGIYFAKNLVGGDTLLDWIMSTIVAGIFGLVNFAWWKGREGGVDEAGKELMEMLEEEWRREEPPVMGNEVSTDWCIYD